MLDVTRLPNLIIIGAQKSGTSSLYDWLIQHPEIYGHYMFKDFNFFLSEFYYKKLGIPWFAKQFAPMGEKIIVHGLVGYMYFYEKSLPILVDYRDRYRKDLKLLAILRNPVDRAYSAFWEARKMGVEELDDFEKALERERDILKNGSFKEKGLLTYVDHGFYFKQLIGFKENFGDNLKVLIFEEVVQKPEKEIKKVFEWLGVDKGFTPVFKKVNASGVPRFPSLQKFFYNLKMPEFVRENLPVRFRGIKKILLRKLNIKKVSYPPMKKQTRAYLVDIYKEDIKRLENLLNRKIILWQ